MSSYNSFTVQKLGNGYVIKYPFFIKTFPSKDERGFNVEWRFRQVICKTYEELKLEIENAIKHLNELWGYDTNLT